MSKRKPPKKPRSGYFEDLPPDEQEAVVAEMSADYETAMAELSAMPRPNSREVHAIFPVVRVVADNPRPTRTKRPAPKP